MGPHPDPPGLIGCGPRPGLLAVAGLPLAVGLTTVGFRDPVPLEHGFRAAMVVCAGLLVAAAVLSAVTIDNAVLCPVDDHPVAEPECLTCCPVGAPPLEPGGQARTG